MPEFNTSVAIKGLQMWHKDRLDSETYKRCIQVCSGLDTRSSYRLVLVVLTPIIYSLLSPLLKSEESSPLRLSALCSPLQSSDWWSPILCHPPWCFFTVFPVHTSPDAVSVASISVSFLCMSPPLYFPYQHLCTRGGSYPGEGRQLGPNNVEKHISVC